MKTLKLSHSIISNWKVGRWEEAVAQYMGKPLPPTPAMELGKAYDQKWTAFIEANKKMPVELGETELDNPRTQIKFQVRIPFGEEYEILLRGVPDIITNDRIIDLKCGRREANQYVAGRQLDYYSIFLPHIKEGLYICFNPYTKTKTVGVKYLSQTNRDDAVNEIVTYGGEILNYLLANKLFVDHV